MRNIELKARLENRDAAVTACARINAELQGDIYQVDTYFAVPEGRLKLRESSPGGTELVHYRRPDVSGPKGCDYRLVTVDGPMKPVLADVLGISAVVEKTRTLYLWENVRIHLDDVVGLGHYIEFEAVQKSAKDDDDGHAKLQFLIEAFEIGDDALEELSYLELSAGRIDSSRKTQ